jgi:tRNA threonylcarbamoyladenosine biosynthesis protein TsaB
MIEVDAKVSDISEIAVDIGPGSLSSVRTAIAYANGLAFALGLRVFTANSLELMAHQARFDQPELPILCLRKADGGNTYAGLFSPTSPPELQFGPLQSVVQDLVEDISELKLAGAYRSVVKTLAENVAFHDVDIDAPEVSALFNMLTDPARDTNRLTAMATPLNEAARVFNERA